MTLKSYLKNFIRNQVRSENESIKKYADWLSRSSYLYDKSINCKDKGISSDLLCGEEVIVSLTTYGLRIHDVHLAVESIMQGTVKPNRIILWLGDDMKDVHLPQTLQNQMNRGLQIEYCKDIGPYKKLIHSLSNCPDSCIITVDDDVMYAPDLVENLVQTHIQYPGMVCAGRIHTMTFSGNLLNSYSNWDWDQAGDTPDICHFATGVGGVLYVPHAFTDEVFNENVFMSICSKADDVWFNAMLILSGTRIVKSFTHSSYGEDYVPIYNSQERPLMYDNVFNCGNDVQIKAVWQKYGISEIIERERRK